MRPTRTCSCSRNIIFSAKNKATDKCLGFFSFEEIKRSNQWIVRRKGNIFAKSKEATSSVPGHSLRFKKLKPSTRKVQVIPKSVFLLQEPDLHADEYGLVDNMIILKGQFDLSPESSEEDIRSELVNLFKTKLPGITAKDVDLEEIETPFLSQL